MDAALPLVMALMVNAAPAATTLIVQKQVPLAVVKQEQRRRAQQMPRNQKNHSQHRKYQSHQSENHHQ